MSESRAGLRFKMTPRQPKRRPRRRLGSCRGGLPDNRAYAPTRGWPRTLVALSLSCSRRRSSFGAVPRHAVRPRSRAATPRGVSWHSSSKDQSRSHSVESECNRLVGRGRAVEIIDGRHRHFLGHFHHDLPAIPDPTVLLHRHAFRYRNRESYRAKAGSPRVGAIVSPTRSPGGDPAPPAPRPAPAHLTTLDATA